jgi:hypothetical protein
MPNFENSLVSVSGRLAHPWDFAFYKNNGEIANQVRAELQESLNDIKIDGDGDIDVSTDHGSFYLTPVGIAAGGWLTRSRDLLEPGNAHELAQLIDLLKKIKRTFDVSSYSVRLFYRFTPQNGLTMIGARGFENVLRSILADNTPSAPDSYKFSSKFEKGEFSDLVEVEASLKDVQIRYSRDQYPTTFGSYGEFLSAADLRGMVESIRSFADVLVAAEPERLPARPRLFAKKPE